MYVCMFFFVICTRLGFNDEITFGGRKMKNKIKKRIN